MKRAQGCCPWSPPQGGARDQGSSARRGLPSNGEARALHHQPAPASTLTMPCFMPPFAPPSTGGGALNTTEKSKLTKPKKEQNKKCITKARGGGVTGKGHETRGSLSSPSVVSYRLYILRTLDNLPKKGRASSSPSSPPS